MINIALSTSHSTSRYSESKPREGATERKKGKKGRSSPHPVMLERNFRQPVALATIRIHRLIPIKPLPLHSVKSTVTSSPPLQSPIFPVLLGVGHSQSSLPGEHSRTGQPRGPSSSRRLHLSRHGLPLTVLMSYQM